MEGPQASTSACPHLADDVPHLWASPLSLAVPQGTHLSAVQFYHQLRLEFEIYFLSFCVRLPHQISPHYSRFGKLLTGPAYSHNHGCNLLQQKDTE